LGVDWRSVAGSGAGGRVRERDVQQAARQGGARSAASSLRQIIARRMLESTQTTAPVTLTTRADAENLISLRRQFQSLAANNAANNSGAPQAAIVPSLTDLILKLTAWALGQHPQLNARWHEDECV